MIGGGAAGYVAKYIAKSVGHGPCRSPGRCAGQLWDVAQNEMPGHYPCGCLEPLAGESGSFKPSECPASALARAAPSREDQIDARCAWTETRPPGKPGVHCHKHGEDIKADWRLFMEAMGGLRWPQELVSPHHAPPDPQL